MFAQNENIIIRAAEPIDAELIYKWENDQEIWRVSETYMPYSLYQIEQFLLNNNDLFSIRQIRFIIEKKDNNTNIGCIDLYDFDPIHMRAGIGILLQKDYRKQGYAHEALDNIAASARKRAVVVGCNAQTLSGAMRCFALYALAASGTPRYKAREYNAHA